MNQPIVIIGSGFAAYQLVKSIRRQSPEQAITVITADSGDEYSKPDLSHIFSKKQPAADLIKMQADDFEAEYNISLLKRTRVESIHPAEKMLICDGVQMGYSKLVLATGSRAVVPAIGGDAVGGIITLNSLDEYRQSQEQLDRSESVLVMGAGLIGTEIAMDLVSSGRKVILVDRAAQLISGLLPDFISAQLYQNLGSGAVTMALGTEVVAINSAPGGVEVVLANGCRYLVDSVISAVGLQPNVQLAREAGVEIRRGIVVDKGLRTSDEHIFALGDCAEIDGRVLSFLQPILLSANSLASTLLGVSTETHYPAMLIKVKTPLLPMQLAGETTRDDSVWQIDATSDGMTARAYDNNEQLIGFVVTGNHSKKAFPLLRQLPAMM